MTTPRPQLVIVGAGQIVSQMHAAAVSALGIEVVQVIEPNPSAHAAIQKLFPLAKISPALDQLSNQATCALVASPNALHESQTETLLNRGLHVFCEKPLAVTGPAAQRLVELAHQKNLVLQVGYYRRYHPASQAIQLFLRRHDFGKVSSIFVVGGHVDGRSGAASLADPKLSLGGCTIDIGPHILDRLASWFDSIALLSYADDERGGKIEANALMHLAGRLGDQTVPITVLLSRTSPLGYRFAINAERQTIVNELNTGHQVWLVGQETPFAGGLVKPLGPLAISPASSAQEYFIQQWQEFLSRLDGRPEAVSSLDGAVVTSKLLSQAYATRQPLELPWDIKLSNA